MQFESFTGRQCTASTTCISKVEDSTMSSEEPCSILHWLISPVDYEKETYISPLVWVHPSSPIPVKDLHCTRGPERWLQRVNLLLHLIPTAVIILSSAMTATNMCVVSIYSWKKCEAGVGRISSHTVFFASWGYQ